MAEITAFDSLEEFYALFIRVRGMQGTVLLFCEGYEKPSSKEIQLAEKLGRLLDADSMGTRSQED